MSDPIPRFEQGTTKRFTVSFSAAPVTAAELVIRVGSDTGTVVSTQTGNGSHGTVANSGLTFTAYYTMPMSRQSLYTYTWTASFTQGPVVIPGWFHVIGTIPG